MRNHLSLLALLVIVFVLLQPRRPAQALVAPSEVIADLSITMSVELDMENPRENIVYTIVVVNAGPDVADGAILRDNPWESLELTELFCGDASNAICPIENNTVSDLIGDGIVIPSLGNGGSLTFWVTGRAIGTDPWLENSARITPPTGTSDPVADNFQWLWVYLGKITYWQYLPFLSQAP